MARLIGPDEASRKAETIDSSGRFAAKRNRPATVYSDAAATQLADVLWLDGTPVPGSVITIDAYSMLPLFQFPDGVDTLWVVVDGGPAWPIYARTDDRLDALAARVGTVEGVAAGLGNAATRNVGTTAGTVAAGNDSRLSDARTPLPHAATHAPGGSDPIAVNAAVAWNLAGGRTLVASRLGSTSATVQPAQNTPMQNRIRHVASVACTDVRLVYGAPLAAEADGAVQPFILKVGLEYNGVTYPATFSGRQTATIDPGGEAAISDPIPVQLPAGAVFYTRPRQYTDAGTYVTLSSAASAGDTTLQLSALPGGNTGRGFIGQVAIESPREVVTIVNYSGSAAPYTAHLAAGTANAHASGAIVGGTFFSNITTRGDLGESNVISATDNSWTTTALATSGTNPTAVLASAANIGDTSFQITTLPGAGTGPTVTLSGVTYTVRNIVGTANPYTVYLTSPLTAGAAAGATMTGSMPTGSGLAPTAIVADTIIGTAPAPVLIMGSSTPNGVGQYAYPQTSYATMALDAAGRPYVALAKSGESASQFADPTTSRRRRALISLARWCLYNYGANDVYSSKTYAQMVADTTTILTWVRQRGLKVAVATLNPRTTSTDGWATTGNQTAVNAGTHGVVRSQYNAWVRAGADGLADLIVDLADAVETSRDSGIWKADVDGPYTVDGIHASMRGHELMSDVVTAALPSMT